MRFNQRGYPDRKRRESFEKEAFDNALPFNQRFCRERKQGGGVLFSTIQQRMLLEHFEEYGRAPGSEGYAVWTATYFIQTLPVELRTDGINSCGDWASSSSALSALVGYSEDKGLNFLHLHPTPWFSVCSDMRKLYCISE